MNGENRKKVPPTERELLKFGLTLAIASAVLGALFFWGKRDFYYCFFVLSVVFLVPSLAAPRLLRSIHRVWMALAGALGWFTTRVVLTVLFYVGLTPIGFLGKLFGKRFLDTGRDEAAKSYWVYTGQRRLRSGRYEEQY
jgi:hypothetical protein